MSMEFRFYRLMLTKTTCIHSLTPRIPTRWSLSETFHGWGAWSSGVTVEGYGEEGDAYTVEDRLLLELVSGHVAGAIIERRKAFALQESEARFRAIFEHSAAGICLVGRDGLLMDANPAFEELLGLTRAEVVGCRFDAFLPVKAAAELDTTCRSSFAEGRDTVSLRLPFLRVDGEQRWGRQIVTAVRDVAGDVAFVLAQVEDITEQQQTEARLTRMAFHDALTGLPNRVLFLDRVETALRRARRHETYHFAVLFLDLDRFI